MTNISFSDRLFVTVIVNGSRVLSTSLSGFSSLKELMQHLRKALHQFAGKLLTLQVRNSTRGWNSENQMLFAA